MAKVTVKSFDSPDETRTPDKTKLEVVDLGGQKAARMTVQPGRRGPSASSRLSAATAARVAISAR